MWVMQRLVREVGTGREAVAALAKRFHASEGLSTVVIAPHSHRTGVMPLVR